MGKSEIRLAGTGERVQYLVHDFNDNTIRFVLHYSGILDADICYSLDGNCVLCVAGEYTKEDAVMLRIMLDRMVEEIEMYVAER